MDSPLANLLLPALLLAGCGEDSRADSPPPSGEPTIEAMNPSPQGRCARVCAEATAPNCPGGPPSNKDCFDARCGAPAACPALDAFLACTEIWPRFQCSADGTEVVVVGLSHCQSLYDAYVREAASCSGGSSQ